MQVPLSRSCAALVAAVPLLAPLAHAGDVHLVAADGSGGAAFASIADALAQTAEGDVLLVRPGTYAGFELVGRGATVLSLGGPGDVVVDGVVVVSGLAGSQTVTLVGLTLRGSADAVLGTTSGVELLHCAGAVRVEDCRIEGGGSVAVLGDPCPPGPNVLDAAPAVVAIGCADVALVRCTLDGGEGTTLWASTPACEGRPGAPGLLVDASSVALHTSSAHGGVGGQAMLPGGIAGAGGAGAEVLSGFLYASGSSLRGGDGGRQGIFTPGTHGDGGDGLVVLAGARAALRSVVLHGGDSPTASGSVPGVDGQPSVVLGTLELLPGEGRIASVERLAGERLVRVRVTGQPGDRVWLAAARGTGFRYAPGVGGVWHVPFPPLLPVDPLGTIPASGTLDVGGLLPPLHPGEQGAPRTLQVWVRTAADEPVLGEPRIVTLVDCGVVSPDCDGNGSFDVCDLLQGTPDCDGNGLPDPCQPDCDANGVADVCDLAAGAPDANRNGIPDVCEPVVATWYVEAAASPGGDGSPAQPLRTLQEAVSRSLDGHTVVVRDGVYVGAGNRDIDLLGLAVTIRSESGPAGAIIDCEGLGRGFVMRSGEGPGARLEGLTIRNGDATLAPTVGFFPARAGGGIAVEESSPTITGCVIEGCFAPEGAGGVHVASGAPLLRGCRLEGNTGYVGGAWLGTGGLLVGCEIVGNLGAVTGGVRTYGGALVACRVAENVGDGQGGGVSVVGPDRGRVDGCLVVGNSALRGAGIHVNGEVTITGTTFAHNHATDVGGALRVLAGRVGVVDSIFGLDSADGGGSGISLLGSDAHLEIDHSRLPLNGIHYESSPLATVVVGPQVVAGLLGFVNANGPDGLPATTADNNYRLAPGSVAIDAGRADAIPFDYGDLDLDGDTTELWPFDLEGRPRFHDVPTIPNTSPDPRALDMGAYER